MDIQTHLFIEKRWCSWFLSSAFGMWGDSTSFFLSKYYRWNTRYFWQGFPYKVKKPLDTNTNTLQFIRMWRSVSITWNQEVALWLGVSCDGFLRGGWLADIRYLDADISWLHLFIRGIKVPWYREGDTYLSANPPRNTFPSRWFPLIRSSLLIPVDSLVSISHGILLAFQGPQKKELAQTLGPQCL